MCPSGSLAPLPTHRGSRCCPQGTQDASARWAHEVADEDFMKVVAINLGVSVSDGRFGLRLLPR